MRRYKYWLTVCLVTTGYSCAGQTISADSLQKNYQQELRTVSNAFAAAYYPHRAVIYSLDKKPFLKKIDSLKAPFLNLVTTYQSANVSPAFIKREQRDIAYFFDRLLLDYPYFHHNHTGKKTSLPGTVQRQLNRHLADFNDPALLASSDFRGYVESFFRHRSSMEVKKDIYKRSDNKRLDANLALTRTYFTNQECRDYWQYFYLSSHLENWGSKHTDSTIATFLASCKNDQYRKNIDSAYTESVNTRKGHLIVPYKTLDNYTLDIHLFLPENQATTKRPAIIYFSGGSWTEGNPEWAFYSCADYAKKGWVAVSVEYRLADRHETTPFEAVKDARSAIRWLRQHAGMYGIDTSRIVASGNSAGGHLVLTAMLASDWNESSDDLRYGASPDLGIVNAGVYDLFEGSSTDWIRRDLKDKSLAKKISPLHLVRSGVPPLVIFHGTKDNSVEYATAKAFAEKMTQSGNELTFHTLEGAPHHIWFDRRFSGKIATLRQLFLKEHGYDLKQ